MAILLGGRDVMGQEVTLSGPAELTVVYKSDGGAVPGSVKGGRGTVVALVPAVEYLAHSASVTQTGAFSFRDVPPGPPLGFVGP